MFTLTITTDGAAFTNETGDDTNGTPNPGPQVAELLDHVAIRLREGYEDGTLRDVNGNPVGTWSLTV